MDIQALVAAQRAYYRSGATLRLADRRAALDRLRRAILERESKINSALAADLNKSAPETYMCEIGMTLSELTFVEKRLPRWMRDRRHLTPLAQFHARSFTVSEPYGVALVMSPWNYPFLLTMEPLIGAVAAGKLILVFDGRKTKLGRAVNSMTTVPPDQSEALKKIKIVAAVDLIRREAKLLVDDLYTGQGNSYDNKMVMVAAFQDFLSLLEGEGVLQAGSGYAELNLEKQRAWLKEQGVDVANMSEQDILKADTGPYIWIKMGGTILDGMEDFDLEFLMGSGTVTGGTEE